MRKEPKFVLKEELLKKYCGELPVTYALFMALKALREIGFDKKSPVKYKRLWDFMHQHFWEEYIYSKNVGMDLFEEYEMELLLWETENQGDEKND